MNKKRLVVANWKMYLESPEEGKKFVAALRKKYRAFNGVEVVLAPAFTLLPVVSSALKGSSIKIGGQCVSPYDSGAHTGSVSTKMLKKVGATYVIVGHSERRSNAGKEGESDAAINQQLLAAVNAGLTAVLCIGERERDVSGSHFSIIETQIHSALKNFSNAHASRLVIAYEPVWAIGKSANEAMQAQDLREMSIFIKKTLTESFERPTALRVPILYGGSVEPSNALPLITEGDISGFLVGHASASVDSFVEILKVVSGKK